MLEWLIPPSMPSLRTASVPASELTTPCNPGPGGRAGPAGVDVAPPLAHQQYTKSLQKPTGFDGIPWGAFWLLPAVAWQTTGLPRFSVSEGVGGVAGATLGNRNAPVGRHHEDTQELWSGPSCAEGPGQKSSLTDRGPSPEGSPYGNIPSSLVGTWSTSSRTMLSICGAGGSA